MQVALCAITSGAESWVTVVEWGYMKLDWLLRWLPFGNGIASHDTFSRVFSLLDAKCFEACFLGWIQQVCPTLQGQLIAIDGKSVRGSHDAGLRMTHLVSAWHHDAGLVLAQVRTAVKSNEITAIPELLDTLDVRGATVTIDAMGCQRAIAEKIIAKKADYLIAVKNNQPTLAQATESLLADVDGGVHDGRLSQEKSVDKRHGPIETRQCVVAHDVSALAKPGQHWPGLRSAVMIKSIRKRSSARVRASARSSGATTSAARKPAPPSSTPRCAPAGAS
ncbi:MAG: hypothetical protein NVS1B6_16370 [Steroidobacteraceae bacterium]